MSSVSLSLALICKNEVHNFPKLLASIKGCFDEIHVTDTGSTDGTLELLEKYKKENPAETRLFVHHFEWVNDFSVARNYSFSHSQCDYQMWLDLDDKLEGREKFISWRQHAMPYADYWLAPYHYGLDTLGNPTCTFLRERVIKNHLGLKWKYFVHEGIWPMIEGRQAVANHAHGWAVKHHRTDQDMAADKSRNLKLFEGKTLDGRMMYYYGKELFENQKLLPSYEALNKALKEELEIHDKILAYQYACYAAMQLNQFDEAIELALKGLKLSPCRAEFYCAMGDSYSKKNLFHEAIVYYNAAKSCNPDVSIGQTRGAIFVQRETYTTYPRLRLACLYGWAQNLPLAKQNIEEAKAFGPMTEMLAQTEKDLLNIEAQLGKPHYQDAPKVEEYVISCFSGLYEWDEMSLYKKGIGGSETAAIHMARALRNLTGKTVRIFAPRKESYNAAGVIYEPLERLAGYMQNNRPIAHIAWRHNVKVTNAPSYVWCHDLGFPGVEQDANYEKVLALSTFHKDFLINVFGVKTEKIIVTRNGIDAFRFEKKDVPTKKEPFKVVWGSSADRGLERAITVMDEVIKEEPNASLHIYYGFENMIKLGHKEHVERFEALIAARPYIKYHGSISQEELTREYESAKVWLYPTNFLETFCITALEMLCCGVTPVVRDYGALPYTLSSVGAFSHIIDRDCVTPEDVKEYVQAVLSAFNKPSCCFVKPGPFSWEGVAKEWLEFLPKS